MVSEVKRWEQIQDQPQTQQLMCVKLSLPVFFGFRWFTLHPEIMILSVEMFSSMSECVLALKGSLRSGQFMVTNSVSF